MRTEAKIPFYLIWRFIMRSNKWTLGLTIFLMGVAATIDSSGSCASARPAGRAITARTPFASVTAAVSAVAAPPGRTDVGPSAVAAAR